MALKHSTTLIMRALLLLLSLCILHKMVKATGEGERVTNFEAGIGSQEHLAPSQRRWSGTPRTMLSPQQAQDLGVSLPVATPQMGDLPRNNQGRFTARMFSPMSNHIDFASYQTPGSGPSSSSQTQATGKRKKALSDEDGRLHQRLRLKETEIVELTRSVRTLKEQLRSKDMEAEAASSLAAE